jgi:hypothetical protein
VIASKSGDELSIRGDGLANTVSIVAEADGDLVVTSGTLTRTFRRIEEIHVHLKGGADDLTVDLSAALGRTYDLDIKGGAGSDAIVVNLGFFAGDEDREIDVNLGGGTNELTILANAIISDELSIEVEGGENGDDVLMDLGDLGPEASLEVSGELGNGDNRFDVIVGRVFNDAEYSYEYEGGWGIDNVIFEIGDIFEDAEVEINVETRRGNDLLTAIFGAVNSDADVEAEVDGGGGFDSLFATLGPGSENIDFDLDSIEFVGPVPPAP